MGWDVWELIWGNTAWGLLDSQVGANEVVNMYLYFWKVETYVETSPGWVLPVISFSHASAHSRTMSAAYLLKY